MIPLVRVCCVGAVAMVATTVMAQPTRLLVGPFSHLAAGGMPVGWEQMRFPSITAETEYGLVSQNGRVVLEARSQASASAALKWVSIDVERRPVIHWSWKTNPDCYAGDWGDPETDDFPLRLFVIFEPTGGMFSRLKRLGPGFQGDSIVYVPQSVPARTFDSTSHVNARIKVLPVQPVTARGAGATDDDGWAHHRRDVRADYVALFGREADTVAGVAVMTDTDNSGTACVSHFGDISFSESAL